MRKHRLAGLSLFVAAWTVACSTPQPQPQPDAAAQDAAVTDDAIAPPEDAAQPVEDASSGADGSFTVPSLDPYLAQFESPAVTLSGAPYDGRRAGMLRGPSGEHIELVEATRVEAAPASGGTQ